MECRRWGFLSSGGGLQSLLFGGGFKEVRWCLDIFREGFLRQLRLGRTRLRSFIRNMHSDGNERLGT